MSNEKAEWAVVDLVKWICRAAPRGGKGYRSVRVAGVGFGWIANGTMIVLVIAYAVLARLSGSGGSTDLPSTRRKWLVVAAIILLVFVGVVAYHFIFTVPPAK